MKERNVSPTEGSAGAGFHKRVDPVSTENYINRK